MMHVDTICACIYAYNLRILKKLCVAVNGYTFVHINYKYNINILNKISIAVNGYAFAIISHAMRWVSDEDNHII